MRHFLWHDADELVATNRRDQGQASPGVASRRLDQRCALLEQAAPFGVFDDRDRDAVLDAVTWVLSLSKVGAEVTVRNGPE